MSDQLYADRRRKWKFKPGETLTEVGSGGGGGTLYRTVFDQPITVTGDEIIESVWTKKGLKMTLNGVDIPSKTEVVK
jgi:hypothetical protein